MGIKRSWCRGVWCLGLVACFGLSACSEQKLLCKQAMELRATQLAASEGDRQKFIDNCRTRGNAYPAEQWRCIIAKLEQGTAYDNAVESCVGR